VPARRDIPLTPGLITPTPHLRQYAKTKMPCAYTIPIRKNETKIEDADCRAHTHTPRIRGPGSTRRARNERTHQSPRAHQWVSSNGPFELPGLGNFTPRPQPAMAGMCDTVSYRNGVVRVRGGGSGRDGSSGRLSLSLWSLSLWRHARAPETTIMVRKGGRPPSHFRINSEMTRSVGEGRRLVVSAIVLRASTSRSRNTQVSLSSPVLSVSICSSAAP